MYAPFQPESTPSTFVELDRDFLQLPDTPQREEAAADSYLWARHYGGNKWDKLL